MYHNEYDHDREHGQYIMYVNVSLVVKQGTAIPLGILDHSEHRPNHGEGTCFVRSPDVLFPGKKAVRLERWDEHQSSVEASCDHIKKPKSVSCKRKPTLMM